MLAAVAAVGAASAALLDDTYNEQIDRQRVETIVQVLGLDERQAIDATRIAMSYVWIIGCKGAAPGRELDAIQSVALSKAADTKFKTAVLAIIGGMVSDVTAVKIRPEACQLARRMSQ